MVANAIGHSRGSVGKQRCVVELKDRGEPVKSYIDGYSAETTK